MLDNESYFSRLMMPIAIAEFKKKQNINLDLDSFRYINDLLVREYLNEFNNTEFGA